MNRKTGIKIFFSVAVVIAIGFCAEKLIESFGSLLELPWWHHPWLLLTHFSFLSLYFFIVISGWAIALGACGQNISFAGTAYCWLLANAGKYIPGKVFMFAGRLSLSSKLGIRKSACFCSISLEHFFMILATLPFLVLFFFQGYRLDTVFIYAFIPLALIAILLTLKPNLTVTLINKVLMRMQREPLHGAPTPTNMLLLLSVYFVAWVIYGVSGVILTNTLEIQTTQSGFVIASGFVVSWLVGFLSMLTPGGLGVREATLVLLLQPSVPAPQAIALALFARATWTIIEISGVGIGLLVGRGRFGMWKNAY